MKDTNEADATAEASLEQEVGHGQLQKLVSIHLGTKVSVLFPTRYSGDSLSHSSSNRSS